MNPALRHALQALAIVGAMDVAVLAALLLWRS
jgi:hypothetical protein